MREHGPSRANPAICEIWRAGRVVYEGLKYTESATIILRQNHAIWVFLWNIIDCGVIEGLAVCERVGGG